MRISIGYCIPDVLTIVDMLAPQWPERTIVKFSSWHTMQSGQKDGLTNRGILMKFARLLVGLGLIFSGGLAQAQLTVTGSSFLSWSGYNGQPALETGILSSGARGTLSALAPGTATFTYLGNESGYTNAFNFSLGSLHLYESSAVGSTISGLVGAGALDFSFSTLAPAGTFSNGSTRIAYVSGVSTTSYGTFDYVLGFNDSYTGDADFDDFVVGVNFATPVPEPETYAMLLAGLALLGFTARRRKLKAAAAS